MLEFGGNGELRFRVDESDLAGDGVAGGRISNFVAGLADFDGCRLGLSRGETIGTGLFAAAATLVLEVPFVGCSSAAGIDEIGDGVIFNPHGNFNCS